MDDRTRRTEVVPTESYSDDRSQPSVATASTASARREERAVPPPRHGFSGAALAAVAAACGLAAIGTGGWAFVQSVRDQETRPAVSVERQSVAERVVSLVSKPTTERIPLRNAVGRIVLVVGVRGYGVLVLDGLGRAPTGSAYQAWVIRRGAAAPDSAAVFSGREVVVPLRKLVPKGATVAITLERAGGVDAPTRAPKLRATRS